jgi:prohibitin 1
MHYIATEFQFPPIKIRENSMDKLLKWTTRASFLLTTVGTIGYACTFTVNGGERAILWDMGSGIKKEVYGEGINLMIPFYQKPIIFDIRTRPTLISTKTGSKDLQNVNIQLRVLFRPVEKFLPKIYTEIGSDYDQRILPSIGNEVMKAVVAQYDVEELITKREEVSREIGKRLNEKAQNFNIELQDISITHLGFSKDFMQAVEAKQVAQQEAERQKWVVLRAEQEKLAAIIKAEGESEAAYLIAKALRGGPGLIEVRKIQATKEIAQLLSTSGNVSYLPTNVSMLLNNQSGVTPSGKK